LQVKKEKNASKEALDATPLAKFFFRPGGWQARMAFLIFGIPRDDSNGTKHAVNPGDEAQALIGGVQAKNTGADLVETHGPLYQAFSKRGIVSMSRKKQKEDGKP